MPQESYQEHDVVRRVGHERAFAEDLQEPGAESPARGEAKNQHDSIMLFWFIPKAGQFSQISLWQLRVKTLNIQTVLNF